ncbi:MAG: cobalamin-dependent protein [Desulfotignum sp.]|nr:cobalamin-dependent protein [Desulfotignum sp.]MCF8089177.1 cobalamin-dependent protein [Desulfotignum sp.]MCF8138406.1 cobalamin-dependent protein [Desulfotignum sp.]
MDRRDKMLTAFKHALLDVDRLAARQVMEQRDRDMRPIQFAEKVVLPVLEQIGAGWQDGTLALSQVYMAGRICEELIDEMLPPADPSRKNQPKMAVCMLEDHHTLGKGMVYAVLRAGGFDLLDYGVVGVDDLVKRVETDRVTVLLISVLMLPSALKIKSVRQKLIDLGCDVTLIVGGAPFRFDDQLWQAVGADILCENASDVVPAIEKLMEEKK